MTDTLHPRRKLFGEGAIAETVKTAWLSPDGTRRYELTRRWGTGPYMAFIMLNPSTADADLDDPTIRRCVSFAKREGLHAIRVVNLCSWRSPNPDDAKGQPLVADDSVMLRAVISYGHIDTVVCAWGTGGADHAQAVQIVRSWAARVNTPLHHLGLTKDGHPRHPLYLKADTPLEVWT